MDWNALKIFLAIVNKGSLSGASAQLDVNHSTVFRRLGQFEKDIGGRLFERINNQYLLTPMGEELLSVAKNIESSFDDLERNIVGKDIQAKGTVKITAPANIASLYLSQYILDFNTHYPDIHIELLVSNLAFNMKNRQADIAIRATAKPPEYLVGREVCKVGWGIYGSPAYETRFGFPSTINELSDHRMIGATGGMSHLSAFIWLEKYYKDNIITRCDDLNVMCSFAEVGHCLAILPNDQVGPTIKKILPFTPERPSNIWLLTHPDLRKVERIKLVMEYLTQAFSKEQFQ